jgi:ParB family transcriptional regulator, chromosome partitioning protein
VSEKKASKKKTSASKEPSEKKPASRGRKKAAAEPGSRGLAPAATAQGEVPPEVVALHEQIAADGGQVLTTYREPIGGHFTIVAALPLDKVAPTPFQRDLSATHVKRLTEVIDKLDRFLDPIIAMQAPGGGYWTPNGNHRLSAVRALGGGAIVALVVPQAEVAYKILALNTEKAHNVREKALEVIRMARSLAELGPQAEADYALEFEDPQLITLGVAYERKPRFSGGAYSPVLKRIEGFLDLPLSQALPVREARATALLALDEVVSAVVAALKDKGLESPYLKTFVIARINPLRFAKGEVPPWDEVVATMTERARGFDTGKVDASQLASTGGAPAEE